MRTNNITSQEFANRIVAYCWENKIRFLFISGNGGSGKTELSKMIRAEASNRGHANAIDMDDFVVDTQLRNSGRIEWTDVQTGEKKTGKYSTSFAASYFLQNVNAIICNLSRGNNYWHWSKKAKTQSESVVELKADATLTIIEGVGSVFLNKKDFSSLSVFIRCTGEIEIARRIQRARFSNEQDAAEVRRQFAERNSQFECEILPYAKEHQIHLESLVDFTLVVTKDDNGIFQR